jgi:hypothetical protein
MPWFALWVFSCAPVSGLFAPAALEYRREWNKPISLKNLEALDRWPEVELSPEARQALDEFREAERRRREYCGRWF